MRDERGRPDLREFTADWRERLYNVGRLDADTSGLLDPDERRRARARARAPVVRRHQGVHREGGGQGQRADDRDAHRAASSSRTDPIAADKARLLGRRRAAASLVELTLHSGRNRIVRRMMAEVGHPVVELVRRQFGPLHLGTLPVGRARELTKVERGALLTLSRAATAEPPPRVARTSAEDDAPGDRVSESMGTPSRAAVRWPRACAAPSASSAQGCSARASGTRYGARRRRRARRHLARAAAPRRSTTAPGAVRGDDDDAVADRRGRAAGCDRRRDRTRTARASRTPSSPTSRASSSSRCANCVRAASTSRATSARTRSPGASAAGRSRPAPTSSSGGPGWSAATRRPPPPTSRSSRVWRSISARCPLEMTPEEHDRSVALVSHVPQLVASLLAGRFVDAPDGSLRLAGQGVRDTTRIAASAPELWVQILGANAEPVVDVLDALAADLDRGRRGAARARTRRARDARSPTRSAAATTASSASPASTARTGGSSSSSSWSTTPRASSAACSASSASSRSTSKTCGWSTRRAPSSASPRSASSRPRCVAPSTGLEARGWRIASTTQ